MTPDNQKALEWIENSTPDSFSLSIRDTIEAALTAQTVTDDEVRSAREEIEAYKNNKGFDFIDSSRLGKNQMWALNKSIETLIRAATAPKNCDELVKALEKLDEECDDIISRANHQIKHCRLDGHISEENHQEGRIQAAIDISEEIDKALAAHKAQGGV